MSLADQSINNEGLKMDASSIEVSVVMPCLNESKTLGICIGKALKCLSENGIKGEIIIADNGSTDGSQQIGLDLGAIVVHVEEKGYGNALFAGFQHAKGQFILMGDSDDSYDFQGLMPFIMALRSGKDLVMGNRFKGGIEKGAMPFLHKYLGNPVLSFIGKLFFRIKIGDFHCGLRGFTKEAFQKMDLRTTGMEFASEIVVKSALAGLTISEVPTTLKKDGRDRAPHLNTWRDGWRHLRFLLLYSPKWLFMVPGILLMLFGSLITGFLYVGPVSISGIQFDFHTMLFGSSMVVIGFTALIYYALSMQYAESSGLRQPSKSLSRFNALFSLEIGLILGLIIAIAGLGIAINSVIQWSNVGFGGIPTNMLLRPVILATTLSVLGIQLIFSSFLMSILSIKLTRKS